MLRRFSEFLPNKTNFSVALRYAHWVPTDEELLLEASPSLTERLQRFAEGNQLIADEVLRSVMPELHRIAARALGKGTGDRVCATELINEFWLKKLSRGSWQIQNRQHFYALAAYAMRQVLIELARQQKASKRGGEAIMQPLGEDARGAISRTADPEAVIYLGTLMDRLEKKHPEAARIADLHYIAGFTLEEVAEITGLSFRQVRHFWQKGSDWLKDGFKP